MVELDGLRGLAILAVMAFHSLLFEPWNAIDAVATHAAGFGWAGVDLFFTLSGFLITGILWDTREQPDYLRTFFARRTLRIFPLYYGYLIGLAVFAYLNETPETQAWRSAQGWYWTYTTNLFFAFRDAFDGGYLYTGHLWSLAIEEQFYLLWPFAVWKLPRKTLMRICAAVFVASLALRIGVRGAAPDHVNYVFTASRIDSLMAGAFVALLMRGPYTDRSVYGMGIGAIVVIAAIGVDMSTKFTGAAVQTVGFSGLAILSASFILYCARRKVPVLRWAPLTQAGKYSYGLYVLHPVVFAGVFALWPPFPETREIMLPQVLLRAIVCWLAAAGAALLSWHLIEKRFLSLKPEYGRHRSTATTQES